MTKSDKKILVVEDEVLIAMDLVGILQSNGFTTSSFVDNAEKAIGYVETENPDLVLMDISLNGNIDGIEATKIINIKNAKTPVIYLTSYSNEAIRLRADETNYYDYILKPYNEHSLLSVINSVFT